MDQIIYKAATNGRTDDNALKRIKETTVGDEIKNHKYFFKVLNNSLYREIIRMSNVQYTHFTNYGKYSEVKIKERPDIRVHLQQTNDVVLPLIWARHPAGFPYSAGDGPSYEYGRMDNAIITLPTPLPTRDNLSSIGKITPDSIMDDLGHSLTRFLQNANVTNYKDRVDSIHSYRRENLELTNDILTGSSFSRASFGPKNRYYQSVKNEGWEWLTWND